MRKETQMMRFAYLLGEAAAKDQQLDNLFFGYMRAIPDVALQISHIWDVAHWKRPFATKKKIVAKICELFQEKGKVFAPERLDFPQDRIPLLQAFLIGHKSVSAADRYVRDYAASLSDRQLYRLASLLPEELNRPAYDDIRVVTAKLIDTALKHAAARHCYAAVTNSNQSYHHRRRDARKVSQHVLRSVGWCEYCGAPLFKSETHGYDYKCFECEADFYAFEQGMDFIRAYAMCHRTAYLVKISSG